MFDPALSDRIAAARRNATPLPWSPPVHDVPWLPYRRVRRPLIAAAIARTFRGVVPALRSVDLRLALEVERFVRILDAISDEGVRAA